MGKKGTITTSFALIIFLVSALILAVPLKSLLVSTKLINDNYTVLEELISHKTSLERLYSNIYKNISYTDGTINCGDYEFKIRTLDEVYVDTEINKYNTVEQEFEIQNATGITIETSYWKHTNLIEGESSGYTIELVLVHDDGSIRSIEKLIDINTNIVIEIPTEFVYNKVSGETNYGTYKLYLNADNCDVETKVKYKDLVYRTIEVTDTLGNKKDVRIEWNNKGERKKDVVLSSS